VADQNVMLPTTATRRENFAMMTAGTTGNGITAGGVREQELYQQAGVPSFAELVARKTPSDWRWSFIRMTGTVTATVVVKRSVACLRTTGHPRAPKTNFARIWIYFSKILTVLGTFCF
jgi:hypothetical protein